MFWLNLKKTFLTNEWNELTFHFSFPNIPVARKKLTIVLIVLCVKGFRKIMESLYITINLTCITFTITFTGACLFTEVIMFLLRYFMLHSNKNA